MRVPGEDEIAFTLGQVPERTRIVQQHDSHDAGLSRVLLADALEVGAAIAPDEVHPHDLDRPGARLDDALVVDEQRDAVVGERFRDRLDGLVIVVAVAREHFPWHLAKWLEGAP